MSVLLDLTYETAKENWKIKGDLILASIHIRKSNLLRFFLTEVSLFI